MSAATVEFDFKEFGVKGTAIAFTQDSFARYVDEHLRNADDASHSVVVRNVSEPGFDELDRLAKTFPLFPQRVIDVLVEDAGFVRSSAVMVESLNEETPSGVLRLAGLSAEEASKLRADAGNTPQRIVIVRDGERQKLFACVLRTDGVACQLLREERTKGKGYGKACRSAALSSIAWSDKKPEEAFERYPAIPALVLAEHIIELGGVDAVRTFRRR